MYNFKPQDGLTQTIAATSTSAFVQLSAGSRNQPDIAVFNEGTTTVFVKCRDGVTPVAAAATDFPIPPGSMILINKETADRIACIRPTGTGNVYITPGKGF